MASCAQLSLLAQSADRVVPVYLSAVDGAAVGAPPRSSAVVERLRLLVGAPRVQHGRLSSEIGELDAWLRGWPRPGITEIAGRPGAGRLAPLLPALARL